MSKSNNSTGSDENIRNCIVNPLATIDGPDITSVNKEGYRETQHDAANETKNTAIHDNHSSDVPVLEDSKARIQKNNSKLKRNKDECQYQFPFLLHNFVTEISQKTNNEIVKWADDGESFFMDRSHPDLPSLLKKFFGHDKHESLRRQLNMYGFKLIK